MIWSKVCNKVNYHCDLQLIHFKIQQQYDHFRDGDTHNQPVCILNILVVYKMEKIILKNGVFFAKLFLCQSLCCNLKKSTLMSAFCLTF